MGNQPDPFDAGAGVHGDWNHVHAGGVETGAAIDAVVRRAGRSADRFACFRGVGAHSGIGNRSAVVAPCSVATEGRVVSTAPAVGLTRIRCGDGGAARPQGSSNSRHRP